MLYHNLLLIYRNFKRFKSTFFINLIGLSTGLACALFIYLWVSDELRIDKFHEKESQLYQVRSNYEHADGIKTNFETDGLLAETLAKELPDVEYATVATPVWWFEKFTLSVKDQNIKATGRYAGEDYFNMFSFDLVHGDKNRVLADKNNIVISEELALNLFKTKDNVVGKTIEFQHEELLTVTGIFKGIPRLSTEKFDFVLPFKLFQEANPQFADWNHRGPSTYIVLHEGADIEQFNKKITSLYKSKITDTNISLFVTPFADNYLRGNYENGVQAGGRITYVYLFSVIAIFILVIACINFMNLSTAKASRRLKEVGIKKAMGVDRSTLISQYLGESILLAFLSLITALVIVVATLPLFNEITGKLLSVEINFSLILMIFSVTFFTGILAGSYPALYLSGFKPVSVLKGKLNASVGEVWARKGLVVFQFTISIVLIVAVLVVYKQIEYVQSKNIGYDKDNVVIFDIEGKVMENRETFLSEIKNVEGIINATSSSSRLIGSYGATSGLNWEGKNPEDDISFELVQVNYDMIETLGIEILDGRSFTKGFSSDSSSLILNEAAIKAMRMSDPVGKVVNLWGMDMRILGVMKDFHLESLYQEVKPLFFRLLPKHTDYIHAKIEAGKERETLARLQAYYEGYNPGFLLDFKFMDENYQALYASEKRISALSKYFAVLAILISCLGLFGLAAFTAERRLKEIGIRKVLGSSEFGIIKLLSTDFTKMVFVAICISLPLSYFLVKTWLDNFAFKIQLEWWYFIGAGFIALVVAWLTVGSQALKAAGTNPANCLKDE